MIDVMTSTTPSLLDLARAAKARAADAAKAFAHAKVLLENAEFRAEVLCTDTYTERGQTHFYPKGKAALTRLAKRERNLKRAQRDLQSAQHAFMVASAKALHALAHSQDLASVNEARALLSESSGANLPPVRQRDLA